MKKILVIVLIFMLFGCNNLNNDEVISEYKTLYENYKNVESINVKSENDFIITTKFDETSTEILDVNERSIILDYTKSDSQYNVNVKTLPDGLELNSWHLDDTTYIENEGLKFSYEESLEEFILSHKILSSVYPLELEKEDILGISKPSSVDGKMYEFKLSSDAAKKLVLNNIYNYISYNDNIFELVDIDAKYKVVMNTNSIISTSIVGTMEGFFINEYVLVKFEETNEYSNLNSALIDIPEDIELFKLYILDDGSNVDTIKNKEDFIQYLLKVGYKKTSDNLYVLSANDILKYTFDFDNKVYILKDNGISYEYYWDEDLGISNGCTYDFTQTTIYENECSNIQIFKLNVSKNSFFYDILESNLSDLNLLN
ncbi:MAG: hypothetical protein GX675_02895 [Erysipelotrichaceae bacterium]|nr:hypothetical protein [Erysipelotrichaceae bacterium]